MKLDERVRQAIDKLKSQIAAKELVLEASDGEAGMPKGAAASSFDVDERSPAKKPEAPHSRI